MTQRAQILKKVARIGVLTALGLSLGACTATYQNHGYVPSEEDLAEIIVGIDTRDSVSETVGPPSSSGVLNDGGYYYVRSRVQNRGLRGPRVVSRELVAISFSGTGVVENIERFDLEDGRDVRLTRRVTDSPVSDSSFVRQLLGNLGRFSPGQLAQ